MVIGTEVPCESEDVKRLLKKEHRGRISISDTENGSGVKKNTRKSYTPCAQILINDVELTDDTNKLLVPRSQTYDSSLNLNMKNELKHERKKASSSQSFKANGHYHKAFKDIPKEEFLKESFTCALQKEILYHGKLYISQNWICFHSKVFGKDTKIVIPVLAITQIKKTKTALLVPNAVIISTVTERFIFVSLLSRDSTYKLLISVCSHLEDISTGNSPNPSPAEHSFRAERPASYPLDFNDFSELDGLVANRRKEIDCSSTGSQTAESENSQEFSERKQNTLTKSQQTLVQTDKPPKPTPDKKSTAPRHGHLKFLQRIDLWKIISLNGLLFFYAILVCLLIFSTFYMQSRIGHLEEQLLSLHSAQNEWPVDPVMGNWHINANSICDELTTNLEKLDKIQRNLQRLLEDAN
ncbi:GRAM domain-containing 3 [Pelobates cultripes]|uniref:GRAM domain-containing 3 n=1 Tax=Pelobates cultripes TaxID=61616 RepID=A0AAD1SA88_PELCU|nr:GRAM domain-containing 3 [Pelobates cultripes]